MELIEIYESGRVTEDASVSPGDRLLIVRKDEWNSFVQTLAESGLHISFGYDDDE